MAATGSCSWCPWRLPYLHGNGGTSATSPPYGNLTLPLPHGNLSLPLLSLPVWIRRSGRPVDADVDPIWWLTSSIWWRSLRFGGVTRLFPFRSNSLTIYTLTGRSCLPSLSSALLSSRETSCVATTSEASTLKQR